MKVIIYKNPENGYEKTKAIEFCCSSMSGFFQEKTVYLARMADWVALITTTLNKTPLKIFYCPFCGAPIIIHIVEVADFSQPTQYM